MKALLLCAGYGKRLKPLTNFLPKPLLPIDGIPLIEYWLEMLSKCGVEKFLINTHYMSEKFEKFSKKSRFFKKIKLFYEKEAPFGSARTLFLNKDFFDSTFLLIHADNLCFCNFDKFLDTHQKRPKEAIMTMMLFKSQNPEECGVVRLNNKNIVTEFFEKVENPPTNLSNGAVYVCETDIFDYLTSCDKDFSKDVIPRLMGKIATFENNLYHRDIGNPLSYALAQIEIKNSKIQQFIKKWR
jgi:mannose-1-phosphate guanylyltransferase